MRAALPHQQLPFVSLCPYRALQCLIHARHILTLSVQARGITARFR